MNESSPSNAIIVMLGFLEKNIWIGILNQFTKETSPLNVMFVMHDFHEKEFLMGILNQFMKEKSHSNAIIASLSFLTNTLCGDREMGKIRGENS